MYTCCPHCETVHLLQADSLAEARGFVRCGRCGQEFNALPSLSADRPAGPQGRRTGLTSDLPVLGDPALLDAEAEILAKPVAESPPPPWRKWAWAALLAALVVVTLLNLAWMFRDTLLAWPPAKAFALRHGLPGVPPPGEFRDPQQVQLVSRDFHAHPSRPGVLVLSATVINQAPQAQPYPALLITLLNTDSRPLAQREFRPAEYLLAGVNPASLMSPGVRVPLLLEFADPGEQAVGFELEFR